MSEPTVIDKRPTYDDSPAKPFTATPLGDYIVVKRIPEPEGVVVLADISKEKPIQCEVVAVPHDLKKWAKLSDVNDPYSTIVVTPILEVGDKVLIRRYSGTEVEIDKQEYTLILIHDVLLKL